MSCCCSQVTEIGCVDYCTATDTGYNATQTGVHTFEVYISQGHWLTYNVTITSGNDIDIPAGVFPETGDHDFKLKQPDGTYYTFGDNECARVTMGIYAAIVT